jgi:hypothetical protein
MIFHVKGKRRHFSLQNVHINFQLTCMIDRPSDTLAPPLADTPLLNRLSETSETIRLIMTTYYYI